VMVTMKIMVMMDEGDNGDGDGGEWW
jgi:hypothetical protein